VLLGDPVEHSISPDIHEAVFARLGIDASYGTQRVGAAELPVVLRAAAEAGGGNVTLPHKEAVAALLDHRTPAVVATGACNCFWLDPEFGLAGDNTDVGGFLASLSSLSSVGPTDLTGARVLLLGAGGGARAVLHGCVLQRAAEVEVWNRDPDRADRMVSAVAPDSTVRVLSNLEGVSDTYDLVVNATSIGLEPSNRVPPTWGRLQTRAAFDLVYATGGTTWTKGMTARGIPAIDGLEMLVQQAALSLRIWFADSEPPLGVMRMAARDALRRRESGRTTPR
jgi:shikimate dehydrogenase